MVTTPDPSAVPPVDEVTAGGTTAGETGHDQPAVDTWPDGETGATEPPRAGADPTGAPETAMPGWLSLTLGLLAVVVGALWTVQGLGRLDGSVLSGRPVWAVVGPGLVLVGLVLLRLGLRARNRRTPSGSDTSA